METRESWNRNRIRNDEVAAAAAFDCETSKKIYPPLKNHFELSAMIILKKHLIKKGMSPESNKIISLDKKIDNIWLQINLFSTN